MKILPREGGVVLAIPLLAMLALGSMGWVGGIPVTPLWSRDKRRRLRNS